MRKPAFTVAAALLLFLCIGMPQSSAVITTAGHGASWSEAVDGLQCRLVTEKSEYAAGEPVVVEFQLRNVGDGPVVVYQGYHTAVTTRLDITDGKGQKAGFRGYVSGVGLLYPTLLPGTNGHLDRTGYNMCGKAFDLAQEYGISDPGTYDVSAVFYGPESGPVHPKFETNDIPVWTGQLESGTIEITVSPGNDGE